MGLRFRQLRKKALLILAIGVVTLVAVSLLIWSLSSPQIPPKYNKSIVRNFESQEEENALVAAESTNYSAILSSERFDGSSDPEDYLNPGIYLSYTYANFIDSEALNYYETRYDNLQGKEGPKYPKAIEMTYEANATKRPEFRIYNSPAPEGVSWHNVTIVMSSSNGSVQFNSGSMKFFYWNQSGYQRLDWGFDLNFSDCYVAEMKMVYSEYYAPLAAFWSDVHQIVVLDQNLMPLLLGVETRNVVA